MRDVGLLISLQALLARRALLNANISLNNNPPSFLEAVIDQDSETTNAKDWFVFVCDALNRLFRLF